MKYLALGVLLTIALPGVSRSAEDVDEYSAIADICVRAQDPAVCMESYGFQCHRGRRPQKSFDAFSLGCNLPLPDGRMQFVQVLYNDGGWVVEHQHKYVPEPSEFRSPAEDSGLALQTYVESEMKDYSMYGGGTDSSEYFIGTLHFEIGTRRDGDRLTIRGLCGVVVNGPVSESTSRGTSVGCEQRLLRSIRMLSQPAAISPYRAAGATEIEWTSKTTRIVSGDTAIIVAGRYVFPKKLKSCRYLSDCCSQDGSTYLDSCRIPTESELQVIESCIADDLPLRSDEYFDCLRAADVKIGCEDQDDGSRICY